MVTIEHKTKIGALLRQICVTAQVQAHETSLNNDTNNMFNRYCMRLCDKAAFYILHL